MIADSLSALIAALKANTEVNALVAGRVFGAEMPASEVPQMPRAAIMLRWAGGLGTMQGQLWHSWRVDVWAFGTTPFQAMVLNRTLYGALKQINRRVYAQTLIHSVREANGPYNMRDEPTEWPFVMQSFQVFAADQLVV